MYKKSFDILAKGASLKSKRADIDEIGTFLDSLEDYEHQRIIERLDKLVA